jgi:hypothetical protein
MTKFDRRRLISLEYRLKNGLSQAGPEVYPGGHVIRRVQQELLLQAWQRLKKNYKNRLDHSYRSDRELIVQAYILGEGSVHVGMEYRVSRDSLNRVEIVRFKYGSLKTANYFARLLGLPIIGNDSINL